MKKFLLTLAVIAMAVPAMATVNFSASGVEGAVDGEGLLTIAYSSDAGELPRGVALTIDVTGGTVGDAVGGENGDVVSMDAAFNCYMDYANFMELDTPGSYTVGAGHPLAAPAQAGLPTFPASSFSVCMGVLDEGGNQNPGPLTATDLITIQLSGAATVDIAADTYRSESGAVGSTLTTNLPLAAVDVPLKGGVIECILPADADYANWEKAGKPLSWCTDPYTCKGDADGAFSGKDVAGKRIWVDSADLTIFLAGWQKNDADVDMPNWISADCNRAFSGKDVAGKRIWVDSDDLGIFLAGWQKNDADPIFSTTCPHYVAP